jgi:prepilin-type N-terminal cleavage/methylation domain-containing protein
MLTRRPKGGFTIVEVIVALVILSAAVLGLAASASSLTTHASRAELRTMALYSVAHRIAIIELDTRYADLEGLYAATESDVLAVPGYTRTTVVDHFTPTTPAADYKVVTVSVSGPMLATPVTHRLLVTAP